MLEGFTSASFAPLLGQAFEAVPDGAAPVELVLTSCDETGGGLGEDGEGGGWRIPFSLLFHARHGQVFAQQIVVMRHPDLGEFPLFLVPLGPDERGMRYEAVFS